jgi:hypothetical protein
MECVESIRYKAGLGAVLFVEVLWWSFARRVLHTITDFDVSCTPTMA